GNTILPTQAMLGQYGLTQLALRGLSKENRLVQCAASRSLREHHPTRILVSVRRVTLERWAQPNLSGKHMKNWNEFTHFAGIDWAKNKHQVVILDLSGKIVAQYTLSHDAAGWQDWKQSIASSHGNLAVCVETNQGAVIERLLQSDCSLYPVHPPRAKQYRQRKISSGNKTDFLDAWALADALRIDGHSWRALGPSDPLINELRLLCRDEAAFIEQRTALVNQL